INTLLKRKYKLENPQIEVLEIPEPIFDAQSVADQIALALEKFGPLSFKLIAYRELERLVKAGALGAEIRLSGKLPSERAKSWRFAFGYLTKTGAKIDIVKRAKATAFTRPGVIGIKVSIVPRNTKIPDKIEINKKALDELKSKIEEALEELKEEKEKEEDRQIAKKGRVKERIEKKKKRGGREEKQENHTKEVQEEKEEKEEATKMVEE
ncbi:MAG: hypothetical protein K6T16_01965, partial [Candidatus Pacearchaeota archaeon]|nr:hypothetical protein [Candidatus Pacearchaeota archaeon]